MRRMRRKIRWARLLLVVALFIGLLGVVAKAGVYAYQTVVPAAVPYDSAESDKQYSDRINILLMGLDDGDDQHPGAPRRSDAMILASIHKDDGTIRLLSIPRDTRVEVPGYKGYDKITHAYYYGGAPLAVQTVETLLQVPVDHYVVVDWQAFIKIVDLLGGVDMYVERDMDYEDPYANLAIHLKKGYQHLNGQQTGQYVRFRSDELGDIGRVQRQQRFLKAMAGEVFNAGAIVKVPELVNTMNQYIVTDVTGIEAVRLVYHLRGLRTQSPRAEMLPGKFADIGGLSYWNPDREQTRQLVQRLFVSQGSTISSTFGETTREN